MNVPQVIAQIDALNGKTVRGKGYLGTCEGYDCLLFVNRADHVTWGKFIAALRLKQEPKVAEPSVVGIGGFGSFDAKAARFQNSYVVITGKVTNECRFRGKPACTDRSTDLEPIDIVSLKDS